jgi:hypothetical protein
MATPSRATPSIQSQSFFTQALLAFGGSSYPRQRVLKMARPRREILCQVTMPTPAFRKVQHQPAQRERSLGAQLDRWLRSRYRRYQRYQPLLAAR